jgi:hypothetical protein
MGWAAMKSRIAVRMRPSLEEIRLFTYFASLGGQDCFQCGRPVRLYADGGTTVMLRTDRDAPSGTGISRMTLSGHLIDTP